MVTKARLAKRIEDEERTSSIGMLRYASSYLKSALILLPVPETVSEKFRFKFSESEPAYFLAARSIELSLKAFLIGRGIRPKALKYKPYGHDLENLLSESRRRRLGLEVKLSGLQLTAIRIVNRTYKAKEFEYLIIGSRSVPYYWDLISAGKALVNGLFGYCYRRTFDSGVPSHIRSRFEIK